MPLECATSSSHEFVDHTGELHLRIRAAAIEGLFAEAGRALAGLLIRGNPSGAPGPWIPVTLRAPDPEALLVDWLNELIYLAESRCEVPVEFEMTEVTGTTVAARVRAVPVADPPALVKAATLHGVLVRQVEGGLEADVILDI